MKKSTTTSFAIVILLFAVVSCNRWSDPLHITGSTAFGASLYVDNKTHHAYTFFTNTYESEANIYSFVCFREFSADRGTLLKDVCMRQRMRVKNVVVTGGDNGKDLYVAFSAGRTLRGDECTDFSKAGCTDIYFMESNDNGDTWSKPVAVPRLNLDDKSNRVLPSMLYMHETGRLFITYSQALGTDFCTLQIVTRPNGSSIFSNEQSVTYYNADDKLCASPHFTYTLNNTESVLHIILRDERHIRWTHSEDNGVTWNYKEIATYTAGKYFAVSRPFEKDALHLLYNEQDTYYLMYYSDEEWSKSWALPLKMNEEYLPILSSVFPSQKGIVIFTGLISGNKLSTYKYELDWEEITDLKMEPPLVPIADSVMTKSRDTFMIDVIHRNRTALYLSTCTINTEQGLHAFK